MSNQTTMKVGDKFTIAGHMRGRKGQLVIDGRSVKTRRKCVPVAPYEFTVKEIVTFPGEPEAPKMVIPAPAFGYKY